MSEPEKTGGVPLDRHAIDVVKELAQGASQPEIIDVSTEGLGEGLPSTVPLGFDRKNQRFLSLESILEEHRQHPVRRHGTATIETLKSFAELVNRHKGDKSVIFGKASWPDPKLTAVIDYDDSSGPAGNCQHRVVYDFPLTEELKAWVAANGQPMNQESFAAFLEEHAAELASPTDAEKNEFERLFREKFATPSEMLELSRHLEVFVAARAKQGVRLQTGERQIEFAEEHQDAKGQAITVARHLCSFSASVH
ncbi:DUF2303 family protein [Pararhizobium sp.]|uniref:DUF2303 family protein n=1 Tax=Pararhizobium sp. TaxID=1977563 RepID=UPI003D0AF80F